MGTWDRDDEHRPAPLPFRPGTVSNGEFLPPEPTARDREVARRIVAGADAAARRMGVDRRRFLQGASGMALTLGVLNLAACGSDRSATPRTAGSAPQTTAPRPATEPAGSYVVPDPEDGPACEAALGGTDFIFDVHTHHVMPGRPWEQNAPRILDMVQGLVPAGCVEAEPLHCLDRVAYLHDLFLASDTTIALLSDVPNSGPDDAPLPFDDALGTQALADALTAGGASRVLVHNVIAPNFGPLEARLDDMEDRVASGRVAAFKVYTAWGPDGVGYALDDPAIGIPVVEKARSLGVRVMCAHKGLPLLEFDRSQNGPRDIVALAARYPDMDFVVYHGAYEIQTVEGPYDPASADAGIDSLVRAMEDHGVAPDTNLWAELGTTWRETMNDPGQAAHALGKLLKHVGEDRVMWGTDGIWYGSPQPQIMAFRAFQIDEATAAAHGYPRLTPEVKAKVFGGNAAALFGIDPEATRCALDRDGLDAARAEVRQLVATGELPAPWRPRGPLTRREVLTWLSTSTVPWTPW
ncbi:amidohydrolase [Iamia sp. SCSIO 61187]|uniref:amidohydrolase family protein n=1 Tax=Iamia sp. SCSIO 61187 TaxID=2722752 RepID=UPI001C63218F|nr:amidohydrolase family protein [Iamia sp. SCSIO 61187]QYG93066.1 amidohydrolase [Iamia sp. SCSIO 61187]